MRLLEKAPAARFQSAADLEWALGHIASTRPAADGAAEPSARRRERPGWMTAAALFLGAAALLGIATGSVSWFGGHWPTAHRESAVARLSLKIEGDTARIFDFRWTGSSRRSPSRPTARGSSSAPAATDEPNSFCESCLGSKPDPFPVPRWQRRRSSHPTATGSASGERDRILRKVSLAGGSPIEIAQTDAPIVALWTSNDEIVIESGDQHGELWSIPAIGGTPKAIAVRDRSDGELISLQGRVPGSNDLLVASSGDGGTWVDVLSRETERDDDCCAAAAASWRATPGRAISCSRTATRYGPSL